MPAGGVLQQPEERINQVQHLRLALRHVVNANAFGRWLVQLHINEAALLHQERGSTCFESLLLLKLP